MKFGPNQTAVALMATLGLGALVAACGAEPTGSAEDTAAARAGSAGSSIDSFNETDTSAWVPFADGSSSITTSRAADHASSSGASLQVAYRVSPGGYAGLERSFSTPKNWSTASAINLWVNGQATGHTFLVQLYDAGNERWETRFTVGFTGWQQITLPFSAMKAAGWQPPEATADGAQDFSGVTGMSVIPSEGTGSGTVTIDALALGAGSAPATTGGTTSVASPPAPTAPAPTAPAPMIPVPPTLPPAASTPVTAAPTAPASTTAVAANWLVSTTGANGTIIPLYTDPGDSSWAAVIAAKQAHPTVPVIAIVNPNDGPGAAKDASYVTGIGKLVAAGVKVIGYVSTLYGDRPTSQLQTWMDQWRSWYPGVTGIFFDEMANSPGHESYYSALGAYAKGHGCDFTVGNPGTDTAQSYIGTLDVMLIYESDGVPSMSAITGWHSSYARSNFGVIPYKVPSLDAAFVAAARPYVGYIYLQSDDLSNPWDSVPTYLTNLVGALQ